MGLVFIYNKDKDEDGTVTVEQFHNFSNKPFDRVMHYERDEFYAYDDELRIYLGEEFYPDYLKY